MNGSTVPPTVRQATTPRLGTAWAERGVVWHVSTQEENRERGRAVLTLMHELMLTELELSVQLTVDARPDLTILTTERRYFRAENRLRYASAEGSQEVEPDAG